MTPTPSDVADVVDALRRVAAQHAKAGSSLSAALAAEKAAGKDVRSGAVKVVEELARGERLAEIASQLDDGTLTLGPAPTTAPPAVAAVAPSLPAAPVAGPESETLHIEGLGEIDLLPDHMTDPDDDGDTVDVLAALEEEPTDV